MTQAGHITVVHGNLTVDVPRRLFRGPDCEIDEEAAKSILSQDEVIILLDLHEGEHLATCWGCDLTYDYVKINGDYRT